MIVLSALAVHLPENLLPIALDTAREIQEPYYRSDAFSGIAWELKRLPVNFFLWKDMLHTLACRDLDFFCQTWLS